MGQAGVGRVIKSILKNGAYLYFALIVMTSVGIHFEATFLLSMLAMIAVVLPLFFFVFVRYQDRHSQRLLSLGMFIFAASTYLPKLLH